MSDSLRGRLFASRFLTSDDLVFDISEPNVEAIDYEGKVMLYLLSETIWSGTSWDPPYTIVHCIRPHYFQ